MRKRFNRAKLYGKDSKFELELSKTVFKSLQYHPCKLSYKKPETQHTYEPDWSFERGGRTIFIEAKGRFVDRAEYVKYIYVRDSLTANQELVFYFMEPNLPMPSAKRRKDGTIRTHSEWAEKSGFRHFCKDTVHRLLGDT